MWNRRQTLSVSRPSVVRDRHVGVAVELQHGDVGAAGVAGDGDGGWIAGFTRGERDVEGAGDWGEGGNLGRERAIAGEGAAETSAVGFSRCVDPRGVEAVGGGEVCYHIGYEAEVIDAGLVVWGSLPCILQEG